MGKMVNYVTQLHQATSRAYIDRMVDEKVHCMMKAKKYESDYWDGDRRYGYGGYKYMAGRWKSVAKALIENYNKVEPEAELIGYLNGYRGLLLGKRIDFPSSVKEHVDILLRFGGSPIGNRSQCYRRFAAAAAVGGQASTAWDQKYHPGGGPPAASAGAASLHQSPRCSRPPRGRRARRPGSDHQCHRRLRRERRWRHGMTTDCRSGGR